jgi:hypothetical protein
MKHWPALARHVVLGFLLGPGFAIAQEPGVAAPAEPSSSDYVVDPSYASTRSVILSSAERDFPDTPVLAVLMEMGTPQLVTSLVVNSKGAIGMFNSNGRGVPDLEGYELVREVAAAYLDHAADFVARGTPAESYPLPEPDRYRFYLVTRQGVLTAEAAERDLLLNRHDFSRLAHHAQAVMSAIRFSVDAPIARQDYGAARAALAASEDFRPYRYTLLQPQLLNEHRQRLQDPERTTNEIDAPLRQLLNEYPLSIQGNYALAEFLRIVANSPQDPAQKSQFLVESATRRAVADAILASITDSRGGTSTDDAYVVISQVEEYAVMDSLGLRPTGQGLIVQDDIPYDRFDTVDESGSTRQLWFDVSLMMRRGP